MKTNRSNQNNHQNSSNFDNSSAFRRPIMVAGFKLVLYLLAALFTGYAAFGSWKLHVNDDVFAVPADNNNNSNSNSNSNDNNERGGAGGGGGGGSESEVHASLGLGFSLAIVALTCYCIMAVGEIFIIVRLYRHSRTFSYSRLGSGGFDMTLTAEELQEEQDLLDSD